MKIKPIFQFAVVAILVFSVVPFASAQTVRSGAGEVSLTLASNWARGIAPMSP